MPKETTLGEIKVTNPNCNPKSDIKNTRRKPVDGKKGSGIQRKSKT